ncbi:hypothetical protein DEU39_1776 [Chryseobacterium sp. AG363]|nr:hypothetical protein DEU39_1776 [Chryseobacterium sp. AG363]
MRSTRKPSKFQNFPFVNFLLLQVHFNFYPFVTFVAYFVIIHVKNL